MIQILIREFTAKLLYHLCEVLSGICVSCSIVASSEFINTHRVMYKEQKEVLSQDRIRFF